MKVVEHHPADELQMLFRRESEARIAKRIWIIWQARLGKSEPEIAASIGLSRRTVQTWVERYNDEGLAGLQSRPGRGRKPILSMEERQQLVQRVEAGAQAGEPVPYEASTSRSVLKVKLVN